MKTCTYSQLVLSNLTYLNVILRLGFCNILRSSKFLVDISKVFLKTASYDVVSRFFSY